LIIHQKAMTKEEEDLIIILEYFQNKLIIKEHLKKYQNIMYTTAFKQTEHQKNK
jgi:hypothetical protein